MIEEIWDLLTGRGERKRREREKVLEAKLDEALTKGLRWQDHYCNLMESLEDD